MAVKRFSHSTGMSWRTRIQQFNRFSPMRGLTTLATTGCRSPFATDEASTLWSPTPATMQSRSGRKSKKNMVKLQLISVLIDSAASVNLKLSSPPVKLSKREEQCLIWAARGKTYQDISDILNISFGSVKSYLDTARHKLNCANLTHAVGVAIATGVIPAKALQGSSFK